MEDTRTDFEAAVAVARFSERTAFAGAKALLDMPEAAALGQRAAYLHTPSGVEVLFRRLIRAVFFIELCKEDVTSTKYEVRWGERMIEGDPRRAEFDDCVLIWRSVCNDFYSHLDDPVFCEEVAMVVRWGRAPHEVPLDYDTKAEANVHTPDNLRIHRDPEYLRHLKLRRALLDPEINPDFQLFAAIIDKVQTKSYLTDRALTGGYRTNREKRWEAHPASPQFAFRRDCLAIERTLIAKLAGFKAFPMGTRDYLIKEGLIYDDAKQARCPVTLDDLDFELLAHEVSDPTFGRSSYQVGHLNPLKAGETEEFRHTPANIAWITEDGNRIQGHLTLMETREMLLRISQNYEKLIASGEISN